MRKILIVPLAMICAGTILYVCVSPNNDRSGGSVRYVFME